MALFYALLACRNNQPLTLHLAHIDHNWRSESGHEAKQLQKLAESHDIPFHLKVLDPSKLSGNLEMACRLERYRFFKELSNRYDYQGIILGHHGDDLSETVLKRVLEGADWSCLAGLKPEVWIDGLRLLRPLLPFTKNNLLLFLQEEHLKSIVDPTNEDIRFLRARMRQKIIPWLNENFGKNVQPSLVRLGEDMQEIKNYFNERLSPLLCNSQTGPFGTYLNLQDQLPDSQLEIKYLLRLICEKEGMALSHAQYRDAAEKLQAGSANLRFENGGKALHIDRKKIFILKNLVTNQKAISANVCSGRWGNWGIQVQEKAFDAGISNWQKAWSGWCKVWLPKGEYYIGGWDQSRNTAEKKNLDKHWTDAGVPAFIRSFFPIIYQGDEVAHEFLSGRSRYYPRMNDAGIEISLRYKN